MGRNSINWEMRNYKFIVIALFLAGFSSCLKKDEPASIEADILDYVLPADVRLTPKSGIGADYVTAFIKNNSDSVIYLTPQIAISSGATIYPAPGTVHKFVRSESDSTMYIAYDTVVSQNGKNIKHYKITLIAPVLKESYLFPFDDWDTVDVTGAKYYTPSDRMWASGNSAVAILVGSFPEKYPAGITDTAIKGLAARLQTIQGAAAFGAPIAAGNTFWGNFKSGNMADKLSFTKFGQPFYQKPKKISGYYRYHAGSMFTDKDNKTVSGRVDSCFIYGIFYETDDNDLTLDGHNIQTSDKIIAKAIDLQYCTPTSGNEYRPFSIDFAFTDEPDFANKRYKLAIVFTSSKSGAYFEGAVGSLLLIDEVLLECY